MFRAAPSLCLTILLGAASLLSAATSSPAPTPSVSPSATASPSASPADPIDALSGAELQQALTFIKTHYVSPDALAPTELDRATLAGLVDRLGRGVALLSARAAAATPSPSPSYHEVLAGHIGYERPGALRKAELNDLDQTLKSFAGNKVDALILDLRATSDTQEYAMAAEFAKRFSHKGDVLFALRGREQQAQVFISDRSPSYIGLVTVLIDRETAGAPEVLASVLRARDNAILIGEATAGGTVGYADLKLAGGYVLRVAAEEAVLGERQIGYPDGVQPDIAVAMPLAHKREIFAQSLSLGMSPFIFESDRPHLNEAALLAGRNPDIEALQEAQRRRNSGQQPPLHDPVVQRAVDVITSIGVYRQQQQPTPAASPIASPSAPAGRAP